MSRETPRAAARVVGTVVALTPTGLLTLRAEGSEVVREGTTVKDPRGSVRGRVVKVFGPVARPFLSVRPKRSPSPAEGTALLGTSLVTE